MAKTPVAALKAYSARLGRRQAELRLILFDVFSTLYMERSDRERQVRSWMDAAGIEEQSVTVEPVLLQLAGTAVKFVKPEKLDDIPG